MYLFDFIHDESPLFSESLKFLIDSKNLEKDDVMIVTMGKRWYRFFYDFKNASFTDFCEAISPETIDIERELTRIAKTYDTTNLFGVDRLLIKRPVGYQRKMLVYTFLFYEKLFSQKNVTHYFTTGIAYMYNLASYQVAKTHNIAHVSFYDIRNPYAVRTAVSYGVINRFDDVVEAYDKYKKDLVTPDMLEELDKFRKKPSQPTYMKNLINKQTINLTLIKEFFIRCKKFYIDKKSQYDYFTRNPFILSFEKLKKYYYSRFLRVNSKKIFQNADCQNDRFFLFPIHMYPEASTLVLSEYHVNQLESIINISKTIPLDTVLYVKEHKSALGERKRDFYKELRKYPNIKVISYEENTFELIRNSLAVITLSSTVGWEGLLLGKPVLVLGNVFYNDSGLTFKVDSYGDLKKSIEKIAFKKELPLPQDYEERLAYFLFCLNNNSYPFEFGVYKLDITKRLLLSTNVEECAKCIESIIKDH